MPVCILCKKAFKVGDLMTGWDCYDDIRFPHPFKFKDSHQIEVRIGDDLQHVDCSKPDGVSALDNKITDK